MRRREKIKVFGFEDEKFIYRRICLSKEIQKFRTVRGERKREGERVRREKFGAQKVLSLTLVL